MNATDTRDRWADIFRPADSGAPAVRRTRRQLQTNTQRKTS